MAALPGACSIPTAHLVGSGVRVKIDISADYEIQTDTNGFFDTQISVPANRNYTVQAFDPVSGLRGRAGLSDDVRHHEHG
jgi:hypothetical protein